MRNWVDGERIILIVQPKGSEIISHLLEGKKVWEGRLHGWKWKRREWTKWAKNNPDWADGWERPTFWLPGEREWSEGDESWDEIKRAQKEEIRLKFKALSEEEKEAKRKRWARENEEARIKEQAKRLKLLRHLIDVNEGWSACCAGKVEEMRRASDVRLALWEKRLKEVTSELNQWRSELEQIQSVSGSEGHLPTHPDEVSVSVAGDQLAIDAITLSEGVCGDDPSTGGEDGQERLEEEDSEEEGTDIDEDIKEEDGSEGHLPIHPDEVSVTVAGDHLADTAITLSEGVGEDDPSVLKKSSVSDISGIIDAALRRPDIHPEVPDDFPSRTHRPWTSVKEQIEKRHIKGRKAFRYRKWQVKRGE
jgi:hypothetical protein